ncbi:unnamed protein product [Rotaria magnacalcarata]|uniref:NACHT domain-containing protein n=1 Tax=Rotaria magnacalcarata TaxID=392030 RepID=A0A820A4P8_9BILA|nr:unnamed protein product [Rotaria magnacalcarata]CAF4172564.1 unnamed protein product [Rotaria magnacalcarata]
MAEAVNNSSVVCCFLSPEYENSVNCKLELQHAQKLKKRIIPCTIINRKLWKPSPSKWLDLITGSILAIDFSDSSDANIRLKVDELIKKIQNKSSTSTIESASLSTDCLFLPVRDEYIRHNSIQRIMNEEKSFPIEESYINLAMVETKEQQEKEKKLYNTYDSNKIITTFEEIYGAKSSIDVERIFDKCKEKVKRILVLGRAGIGKSTFCRYVTYRWSKGQIWPQYELVVLIQLRMLTSSRYPPGSNYSLDDLIKKEYFYNQPLSQAEIDILEIPCDKSNVLWLLDGYDEIAGNIPTHLEDLMKQLFKTTNHILTSRPYAINLSYPIKMEIIGFTDYNIRNYVKQFFDSVKDDLENARIQDEKLLNFFKENPRIWGVAHIPVNLELICALWCDTEWSETLTLTMTALYDKMAEWICRRYLIKQNVQNKILTKDEVYESCRNELVFLRNLAFEGMKSKNIILKPELFKKVEKQTGWSLREHPTLLNIGILKSFNDKVIDSNNDREKCHYFVHLSFQEYFAAHYLISALSGNTVGDAIKFIMDHKYNRRYSLMLTFASGILAETDCQTNVSTFWDALLQEPLDLVGVRHMEIFLLCLEEIGTTRIFDQYPNIKNGIVKFIESAVTVQNNMLFDYAKDALNRSLSVVNDDDVLIALATILQQADISMKKRVLEKIYQLPILNPHPQLISSLAIMFETTDEYLKEEACKMLGKIGRKVITDEIIKALLIALKDNNIYVKHRVFCALGEIGEKAATDDVIKALLNAFEHTSSFVREHACEALGTMGEKGATDQVIKALINALEHADSSIGKYACKVFGNMGEKAESPFIRTALGKAFITRNSALRKQFAEFLGSMSDNVVQDILKSMLPGLKSDNVAVRGVTCEVLGNMGKKAITDEVLDALKISLQDEDFFVKRNACVALCNMSRTVINDQIITLLIGAVQNPDSTVRGFVLYTLVDIRDNVKKEVVIEAFRTLLKDSVQYISQKARHTLTEMGEQLTTDDITNALAIELVSENPDVRSRANRDVFDMGEKIASDAILRVLLEILGCSLEERRANACELLGRMGEKAAREEIIETLLAATTDQNVSVRRNACDALGNIALKAKTNQIVKALFNALEDNDATVIKSAYEALAKIDEELVGQEFVKDLVIKLKDTNEHVRLKASHCLVQVVKHNVHQELIQESIIALQDVNAEIRVSACRALGLIKKEIVTDEAIKALAIAINDSAKDVSYHACKALENMDEKAATSEIIIGICHIYPKYNHGNELLKKIFSVSSLWASLDPTTLTALVTFFKAKDMDILKHASIDELIKAYIRTEYEAWASIIASYSISTGIAITTSDNSILIYGDAEPVAWKMPKSQPYDHFIQTLEQERKHFNMLSIRTETSENEQIVTSVVCNIM